MVRIIGLSFEFVGTVLVAYAALRVHHRFLKEHQVDEKVFKMMKREQRLGILGVIFIFVGYVLQVFFNEVLG